MAGGAGPLLFGASGLAGQPLPGQLFSGFAGLTTLWALVARITMWRRTAAPAEEALAPVAG